MKTNTETNTDANHEEAAPASTLKLKRLNLKRETLQNLNDQLLTSQGHSLWTCDITADVNHQG
jgi:hypothetical protein